MMHGFPSLTNSPDYFGTAPAERLRSEESVREDLLHASQRVQEAAAAYEYAQNTLHIPNELNTGELPMATVSVQQNRNAEYVPSPEQQSAVAEKRKRPTKPTQIDAATAAELPMCDIRARNYVVKYVGASDKTINESATCLRYLDHIAHLASINIANWKPIKLLHNTRTGKLVTRKSIINKRFFDEVERLRPAKVEVKLSPTDVRHLENFAENYNGAELNRLRGDVAQREQAVIIKYNEYLLNLKNAGDAEQRLKAYKPFTPDAIITQLSNLISDGWYALHEITASEITLTTAPVMLSHKNASAKIDMTVPMGEYRAVYHLNNRTIRVFAHRDNVFAAETYCHPHLRRDSGEVCFGDIKDRAHKALTTWDIEGVFTIIRQVLTTYCDDNPYIRLEDFHAEHAAKARTLLKNKEVPSVETWT